MAAQSIAGDDSINKVSAVNAPEGQNPSSALADDLRHSQPGTTGTFHRGSSMHGWGQVVVRDPMLVMLRRKPSAGA